jgi:hypothetical protein
MDKLDDRAVVVGLDLMIAMVLVLAAVMLAILIMPSMSHEDRSWRIKQYMAATRASDNLVQDEGQEGWAANWTIRKYTNVTKIGFVCSGKPKVLNQTKIDAMMAKNFDDGMNGTNLPWWEFPNFTKLPNERKIEQENATRALGLGRGLGQYDSGYNFYMRLYPVGLKNFNYSRVETNLSNRSRVPMIDNAASAVDRYVYIKDDSSMTGYLSYLDTAVGNNRTVHYRLNLWVW